MSKSYKTCDLTFTLMSLNWHLNFKVNFFLPFFLWKSERNKFSPNCEPSKKNYLSQTIQINQSKWSKSSALQIDIIWTDIRESISCQTNL